MTPPWRRSLTLAVDCQEGNRKVFDTTRRVAIAVLISAAIAACAPPPPKQPDPTVAQVTLTASDDANPDGSGRPSPAVVFIYALQPGAPFATGSYDALTGGELGDLGETMKRIARIVIVPGKSTKKVFESPDGTSDVGIAVGYYQLDTAKWRASAPVKANEVTLLNATVGANAVAVE